MSTTTTKAANPLKAFRRAVRDWLEAEGATPEQAMGLQLALLGGTIGGSRYRGRRDYGDLGTSSNIAGIAWDDSDEADADKGATPRDCGCLLDTLERGGRLGVAPIEGATAIAFVGATYIRYGDTPSNNKWARAASQGIHDYLRRVG